MPGRPGRPIRDPREVLNGIMWILRTGSPWRDLPKRYPSYQTCHRRFQQWVANGVLRNILSVLYGKLGGQRKRQFESYIDGTYASAKRGGAAVGRCRAGKATKVMAVADAEGLPVSVAIADGSRHDVVLVEHVLDEAVTQTLSPILIGDRAFDSRPLACRLLEERNISLLAPKRRKRDGVATKQDGRRMRRYRRRWKVERLFAWLKQFRRIVVRWEQHADNYLGFLHLGCIAILLRRLVN